MMLVVATVDGNLLSCLVDGPVLETKHLIQIECNKLDGILDAATA